MSALAGKIAVVTGSTSGIGLGIARGLAGAGASVVLNGFGEAGAIERLIAELRRAGGTGGLPSSGDMTRPGEIVDLIESAHAHYERLDILVNNAGIQHVAPIEHFPAGAVGCGHRDQPVRPVPCRSHRPAAMRSAGWGRIINIASAHGLVASRDKSAYVAAKHGLVGLTKVAALETAGSGITCNSICPAWVLTPLAQKQIDQRADAAGVGREEAKRQLIRTQPSGEFITPEQIAGLVVFLCSDAAAQITGAAISIDGGWTAQ